MNQKEALIHFYEAATRFHERNATCAYLDRIGRRATVQDVLNDLGVEVDLLPKYNTWAYWRGSKIAPVETVAERYSGQHRWTGELGRKWLSLLKHVIDTTDFDDKPAYSGIFDGSKVEPALFQPTRRVL